MEWQWWVSQGFAVLGLVCIAISMQQNTRKRLLWYNMAATILLFIGVCFLWQLSAVILLGVNTVRNGTALFFAHFPNTKRFWIWATSLALVVVLVTLNIVLWINWLNILSITIGIGFIIAFMQKTPKTMRLIIVPVRIIALVYFILLFAPINAVIEIVGLTSTIIGIIRLDIKKMRILS